MKNTGDGRRVQRVEREVQMVIAQFLISGFRHPLPGIVTISSVRMAGDLRTAKVYVSVLDEKESDGVVELLNSKAFEIQDHISRSLKMRYCPKCTFYADHTTEQVLKIEKILHDLEKEKKS